MISPIWVWVAHFSSVLFMTGLIWLIQIVQYPLMIQVGSDGFVAYHAEHCRRIKFIVGPAMLIELVSAAFLVLKRPALLSTELSWICLALTIFVFSATAFASVPCHNRLARGFDKGIHRRLVITNWLRTAVWSAHAALAIEVTARALQA